MEKLYKLFEELAIKWKIKPKNDEFLVARLKLTLYYSLTAMVILVVSSVVLYNTILSNFSQSISENIFLSSNVAQAIIDKAQDILLNRFMTIDAIILFIIIILGFLLTERTLHPIKNNMERQKRFIADASHELRTPIAVVISGLEVNLNNKKLDLAGAKKTLENALVEMKEFSKLSNSLLDISKDDTKIEKNYEPILIDDFLKKIVEKDKNLTQIKNINFESEIESSAIIKGDKNELSRVLFNVIDNAINILKKEGKFLSRVKFLRINILSR